jgi:hypothetical protein
VLAHIFNRLQQRQLVWFSLNKIFFFFI